MTTYIIRYFVRREGASEYSWTERFFTLGVSTPDVLAARKIADTLKPRVISMHTEDSEDPVIGDDPVEFSVQSLADYEQQLFNEAAAVAEWEHASKANTDD